VAQRLRRGEHPSLRAAIYEALRRDILLGALPAGNSVNIRDVQERFGVSSSAVREALCQLAADDLVIAQEQRGFRIAATSLRDLEDLTRMRVEIETFAVRDAILNGDDAWETRLLARFHELMQVGNPPPAGADVHLLLAYKKAHHDFHDALVDACTSGWAKRFRSTLYKHAERYSALCREHKPVERDVPAEHRAILSAVLARNVDDAGALIAEHIRETTRILTRAGIAAAFCE
jgi:DNA-binding GntR family transcriptional regulator